MKKNMYIAPMKITKVLAVNDLECFLHFLEFAIKNQRVPIQLEMAFNGQQAIDRLTEGATYDAILMNLEMPGKDGWQATQEIRALGVSTPIIAWSCHDKDWLVDGCINVGMNDYIEIEVRGILKGVLEALDRVGVKVDNLREKNPLTQSE